MNVPTGPASSSRGRMSRRAAKRAAKRQAAKMAEATEASVEESRDPVTSRNVPIVADTVLNATTGECVYIYIDLHWILPFVRSSCRGTVPLRGKESKRP